MADQPAVLREDFVIEFHPEHGWRKIGAQGTTDLHRPHWPAAVRATPDLVHQLAERDAEADLIETAILDIAGDLDRHRAARTAEDKLGLGLGPVRKDKRYENGRESSRGR